LAALEAADQGDLRGGTGWWLLLEQRTQTGVICAGTLLRSSRPRRCLARLGALRWPGPGP